MHKGDDEGRPCSKRVKRKKRPPEDEDEEDLGDDCCLDGEESDEYDRQPTGTHPPSRTQPKRMPSSSAHSKRRRNGHSSGGDDDDDDENCDGDDDDPQPDPPPPPNPPNNARVRLSKCWLCTFSGSKMAKNISSFVSANAGNMDPTIMADQIKEAVLREVGWHVCLQCSSVIVT